jgi:LmbE family N-acetylglucosaminyl deacetylase
MSKQIISSMPLKSTVSGIKSGTQPSVSPSLATAAIKFPWRSLHSTGPVLIVAPHPDDETLGCGGAVALLRSYGCPVWVLVITDGTQSHPRSRKYPAPILQQLREQETRSAMSRLGVASGAVTFLQLSDGKVADAVALQSAQSICRNYLKGIAPKTIFLPWRHDPHPDHRATWQLLKDAIVDTGIAARLIEYPIWDWDIQQSNHLPDSSQMQAWRLNIQNVLGMKQRAIGAYRSQTTDLIDDDPAGFRLTPTMLAHFTQPWEVYFEEII